MRGLSGAGATCLPPVLQLLLLFSGRSSSWYGWYHSIFSDVLSMSFAES